MPDNTDDRDQKRVDPNTTTPKTSSPVRDGDAISPNPPRTTKGGITAPKFGSAGSGGAEYEPGPERD